MMAMIDWWLYYCVRFSPATLTHIFSSKIFQLRAHEGLLIAHVFAFFSISQKLSKIIGFLDWRQRARVCEKCSTDVLKQCLTLSSATSILCSLRCTADGCLIKNAIYMRTHVEVMKTTITVFHIVAARQVAHLVFNLFLDAASQKFQETLTQRSLAPQIPVCIKFALFKIAFCSRITSSLSGTFCWLP